MINSEDFNFRVIYRMGSTVTSVTSVMGDAGLLNNTDLALMELQ